MSRRGGYTPAQLLYLLQEIAAAGDDALEAMLQPKSEPGSFQVLYDPFFARLTEKGALPVGMLSWRLTPQGMYRQALRLLTSASEGKKRPYGVSNDDVLSEYAKVLERVNELLSNRTLVNEDDPAAKRNNGQPPPPPPPPSAGSIAV